MQIVLFHLMPYAELDLESARRHGTVWVHLPNSHFDPEKGHRLYNRSAEDRQLGCAVPVNAGESDEAARRAFEAYWKEMRFGNLLVLCQFATLPADLTRRNTELFAREVMPALKSLQ